MFRKIIDSHIHLDMYQECQREGLLSSLDAAGVDAAIAVSWHLESARKNLQFAKDNDRVKPAFGYHPEQNLPDANELNDLLQFMEEHRHEMVAVGEVGLPYYLRKKDETLSREAYLDLLEVFVQKAVSLEKPIILHAIYDDASIVCDLLETYAVKKAHFHWFKGDNETLQRMAANGYYISITPDVTYETEIQEIVRNFPLDLMMVETDGPWQFEGEFAGEMTHPEMIHQSVAAIAAVKESSLEDTYRQLYRNTQQFYFKR